MEQTKVLVPVDVLEGLETVRLSGRTNMLDVSGVIELAFELEHDVTALWVYENRDLYSQGIFRGFAAAPDNRDSSRHVAQHGPSELKVDRPSEAGSLGDTCKRGKKPCVDR